MSCTAKQLNRCQLIQNSYKSILLDFGEKDVSADTITLKIFDGFNRIEKQTVNGLIDSENRVYFPEFTLAKGEYAYEVNWEAQTHSNLVLFGKYKVTDKANDCGCGSDTDVVTISVDNGDTIVEIQYSEVILNTNEAPGGSVSWNQVTNKPTVFPPSSHTHTWSQITDKPIFFSGNYSDLSGKPVLFSGSYNDLTDKPTLFSGSYTDLTNKPTIHAAQVNSDWNSASGLSQILNKPTLFSGSYTDLSNRPILFSGSYTDLTNKPTIPNAQVNSDWNSTSGVSQILNKPSLFSGVYSDLTGKPSIFSGAYADLTGKPTLFDGTWSSLTGKPASFTPPVATSTVLGGVKIWTGTQALYDAIVTKATDVLYFIEKT